MTGGESTGTARMLVSQFFELLRELPEPRTWTGRDSTNAGVGRVRALLVALHLPYAPELFMGGGLVDVKDPRHDSLLEEARLETLPFDRGRWIQRDDLRDYFKVLAGFRLRIEPSLHGPTVFEASGLFLAAHLHVQEWSRQLHRIREEVEGQLARLLDPSLRTVPMATLVDAYGYPVEVDDEPEDF